RDVTITTEEVKDNIPFIPGPKSAADMLRKVTRFQRKSVEAYFQEGEYLKTDPSRIRIGTIHSAKGREADHIFLATDLTEKVVEHMSAISEDGFERTNNAVPLLTDNERRVFYVGMSRARERLVLLQNLVSGAPTLPLDVLLYGSKNGDRLADSLEPDTPVSIH
ncbi:MAG: 3'-5' exonuclease, partial [Halobacteriaceae archaeon]